MLKGIFSNRQARRDDAELGKGVWRRAHDRFRRGLDRFHQMLEGIAAEAQAHPALERSYEAIVPIANDLADLLPRVRELTVRAQALAPSEGTDIPASPGGYLNDVHRELSRAGNALAAAAEAVAMVRLGVGELAAVERRSEIVIEHVSRAEELFTRGKSTGG